MLGLLMPIPITTGGIQINHLANLYSGSDLTTYNFTDVNLGTAASDRLIGVFACGYRNSTGSAAVNSISAGGTGLTEIIDINDTPPGGSYRRQHACLYTGFVTSGTSGTVSITYNTQFQWCQAIVFSIYGLDSASTTDVSSSSSPDNTTSKTVNDITISSGGIGIFCTSFKSTSNTTSTVTNAIKLQDYKQVDLMVVAYNLDAGTPSVTTSVGQSGSRAYSLSASYS